MQTVPTFKELLDHINSAAKERKANCFVGFFVTEYKRTESPEAEVGPGNEVDSFHVKKPVIEISSFTMDNDLFYEVNFHFKSYNDSDYKQLWKFLCRYAEKVKRESEELEAGAQLDKAAILSISIVPEKFRGKYFVYINMPFIDMATCSENAYDKTAKISFICAEESLSGAIADDDVIDPRSIAREVDDELLAEAAVEEV